MSRNVGILLFLVVLLGTSNQVLAGDRGGWQAGFGDYPATHAWRIAPYRDGLVGIALRPFLSLDGNGDVVNHSLVFWNDGVWTTAGLDSNGFFSGTPGEIVQFGDDVCVGGDFRNLGPEEPFSFLACWSIAQEAWYQPVGPGLGPNGSVAALAWDGASRLYIGGNFFEVKNLQGEAIRVGQIVATDGFSWETLDHQGGLQNGVAGEVSDILPSLGGAYISHRNSVSVWNPTLPDMTLLGTANNNVWHLESFFGDLVAAGAFVTMDGVQAAEIAATRTPGDGDWFPYGDGLIGPGFQSGPVRQSFGFLYAYGAWPDVPNTHGLARWTGQVWEPAGLPPSESILTISQIERIGSSLCIKHDQSSQLTGDSINCKDSADGPWESLSQGFNSGTPAVLTRFQGDLYAGGSFLRAGTNGDASRIARWDGDRWHSVGEELSDWQNIDVMESYGGRLYIAGSGPSSQQVTGAPRVASWDGTQWSLVGAFERNVHALKRHNNLLFVGGNNSCPGVEAICSWDGNTVSSLGFGIGLVNHLASYQDQLIVAGNFTEVDGTPASGIAAWSGTDWTEFAGGVYFENGSFGVVKAMAASGSDLYLSLGVPGTAGPNRVPFEGVAHWNGAQWTALGDNLTDVTTLELRQGELYASGLVTLSNGQQTNTIARWMGTTWQPLAGSLRISSMAETPATDMQFGSDGLLYVIGDFVLAGRQWSSQLAVLDVDTFMSSDFE